MKLLEHTQMDVAFPCNHMIGNDLLLTHACRGAVKSKDRDGNVYIHCCVFAECL